PNADLGAHEFSYAVLPHAGDWRQAGVVAEAAAFNAPLLWMPGSEGERCFARVDGGLVLDTVKRAEDADALILRLYEPHGAPGAGAAPARPAGGEGGPVQPPRGADGRSAAGRRQRPRARLRALRDRHPPGRLSLRVGSSRTRTAARAVARTPDGSARG